MVAPGSELATHQWLQQRSALGELIDFDFTQLDLMALYRIADRLLAHKPALEAFLYAREQDLFARDDVITLYDLTNTYFEGTGKGNANAAFGRSKEKRSDCPLVTLALVLDASGFAKRSARRRRRSCSTPVSPARRTSPGWSSRAITTWWLAAAAAGNLSPRLPA